MGRLRERLVQKHKQKYITTPSARVIKLSDGVYFFARQNKLLSFVEIYLYLKTFNVEGVFKKGELTPYINKAQGFSAASFWKKKDRLFELGILSFNSETNTVNVCSHDYLCKLFQVDIKAHKITKIPYKHIIAGTSIEFIMAVLAKRHHAAQRGAILRSLAKTSFDKQADTDKNNTDTLLTREKCATAKSIHLVRTKKNPDGEARMVIDQRRESGVEHQDLCLSVNNTVTSSVTCDPLTVSSARKTINYDVNSSLKTYAKVWGLNSESEAHRWMKKLETLGFVSVTRRVKLLCDFNETLYIANPSLPRERDLERVMAAALWKSRPIRQIEVQKQGWEGYMKKLSQWEKLVDIKGFSDLKTIKSEDEFVSFMGSEAPKLHLKPRHFVVSIINELQIVDRLGEAISYQTISKYIATYACNDVKIHIF